MNLILILLLIELSNSYTPLRSSSISRCTNHISLNAKALGSKGNDETFLCQSCGAEHIKWVGKCNICGTWNSVKEFRPSRQPMQSKIERNINSASWTSPPKSNTFTNDDTTNTSPSSSSYKNLYSESNNMKFMDAVIVNEESARIKLFSSELNQVLGGGLVKGSVILCAGEPGIGKSTLMMQIASNVANLHRHKDATSTKQYDSFTGKGLGSTESSSSSKVHNSDLTTSVVYISGEENVAQIVSRARRLALPTTNIYLDCEIEVEVIIDNILALPQKPLLVVIDSVQTLRTSTCAGAMGKLSYHRICLLCDMLHVQLTDS